MDSKKAPTYMEKIWEKVDLEMAQEHETAARELDKYHRHRVGVANEQEWSREEIAKHFALLWEGMIEWVGLMEEDMLLMLFLFTLPETCLIRVDKKTEEYKSALYVLADADGMAVMVDTEAAFIMSGTRGKLMMRCKLPYADLINKKTQEYYNAARSVRQLESITAPTGETVKVLFQTEL